jgi:hypothetical protein
MRNDARPIGHEIGHQSPVVSRQPEIDGGQSQSSDDRRDSVAHQRESHVVNKRAEDDARRDDADVDPVMPTGDSTLKTKM